MLAFLFSKTGMSLIAVAIVAAVIGLFKLQAVQLDHARADLKTARSDLATCRASVATQNAAIAAQSARSTAALEASEKAVKAVSPRALSYARKAEMISVPKPGPECQRYEDVDAEVKEAFR